MIRDPSLGGTEGLLLFLCEEYFYVYLYVHVESEHDNKCMPDSSDPLLNCWIIELLILWIVWIYELTVIVLTMIDYDWLGARINRNQRRVKKCMYQYV